MKEENFASVTNIERVWFVNSDEAVYSKAPYSTTANFLTCSRTIYFFSYAFHVTHAHRRESCSTHLRDRPFNSWRGGGGGGGGVILKKISCKRLSEEKNCMQHKCNRKKFLRCCKKEKNVAKLFHHSGGLYKIAAKLQPFSSLATFELWIWWCCKITASYLQCIISLSQALL